MADNLNVPTGASGPVATDEISGVHYQRIKIIHGADGVNAGDVSDANPLPIDDAGGSVTVDNAVLTAWSKAEDAAHGSGDTGIMALAVRTDTATARAGTDGDYIPLIVDSSGRLHTTLSGIEKAEDAAHTSTDKGIMALGVRQDTAAALGGTDGDYMPLIFDSSGKLWVRMSDTISAGTSFVTKEKTGANVGMTSVTYSAQDTVGGLQTLTTVANTKAVRLDSLILHMNDTPTPALSILVFGQNPTSSGFTNNTTVDVHADDLGKLYAVISVATGDWVTVGASVTTRKIATKGNLNCIIGTSGSVYVAIVTTSSFTGTADALSISAGFTQDG